MAFRELLQKNQEAIVRRWFEDVLAMYSQNASGTFGSQKDPFANPVGHSLRQGTRRIFEALLEGADSEEIRQSLDAIVKVRAVQQFSPSQAVGFVFLLKEAMRTELATEAADPKFAAELAEIERRIDHIALAAFDVFVRHREQVYELRVNEVKRRVSWVLKKMEKRGSNPELAELNPE
jgi:hypothetical protein